jgi:hypothetical protein
MIENDIIEEVVRQVMQHLQGQRTSCACASPPSESANHLAQRVAFDQPVITHEVLEARLNGAVQIEIGAKSVLTPSARDFLRSRKVAWERSSAKAVNGKPGAAWQICCVGTGETALSAVRSLKSSEIGACGESLVDAATAVRWAVEVLRTNTSAGVLAVVDDPEQAACLANRHAHVRAAVVQIRSDVERVASRMGANLICVRGCGQSFFELRNLLAAVVASPAPAIPADWTELKP